MIIQFMVLGIYTRPEDSPGNPVVFDVIVDGKIVITYRNRGTALIRLAEEIDKKVGA